VAKKTAVKAPARTAKNTAGKKTAEKGTKAMEAAALPAAQLTTRREHGLRSIRSHL